MKEGTGKILNKVLIRAKKYNIKCNFDKFKYNEIKYLEVMFNESGISPDPEKVTVTRNPKN